MNNPYIKGYRDGQVALARAIFKHKKDEKCKHCGLPIEIGANNPICNHLYYPENCKKCNKITVEKQK